MAWSDPTSAWKFHDPVFESESVNAQPAAGPWDGHRWFAYDLLRWRVPELVVCVGTGSGSSLFAFAQAVKDGGSATSIVAVEPSGWDSEDVAEIGVARALDQTSQSLYGDVGIEIRQIEPTAASFAEDSIDLLNLESVPSGAVARAYIESWLPKLRADGLLLIHALDGPDRTVVEAYCQELIAASGGFVFQHSFGLAVLPAKRNVGWEPLQTEMSIAVMTAYYPTRARAHLWEIQLRDHVRMVKERDELIRKQSVIIEDRDQSIDYLVQKIEDQEALLRAAKIAPGEVTDPIEVMQLQQLNSVIANQSEQLTVLDNRLRVLKAKNKQTRKSLLAAQRRKNSPKAALKVLIRYGPPKAAKKARAVLSGTGAGSASRKLRAKSRGKASTAAELTAPRRTAIEYSRTRLLDLQSAFDANFYASRQGLAPDIDPWTHYLEEGMAAGVPISATVAQQVERTGVREVASRAWETPSLSEGLLHEPNGAVHPVPLPLEDFGAYGTFVTFDLWDTLIERTRPADSAKLSTARRMKRRFATARGVARRSEWELMAERVDLEAQIARSRPSEEYRANEVLGLLIARYCPESDAIAEADRLVAEEVAEEIEFSRPRREFPGPPPPNAVILSDFYLGAEDLRKIVAGVRPEWANVPLISSCDANASKRVGGDLFALVREDQSIPTEEHLHVGDNLHSDINMQIETGGRALHVSARVSPYPGPGSLAPAFAEEILNIWPSYVAAELEPPKSAAQASGRRWSFLPASLVMGATEAAIAKRARTVFYLSREGIFLKQVHQAMASGDATYEEVGAAHLAVSRRATFGPSLSSLSVDELMRLWSMYGSQSIRGLLLSLGVEDELPAGLLGRHRLDADQSVGDISNDPRVRSLLDDSEFTGFVWGRLQEQRALLAQYLRQNFARESGEIIVSDVGWRGTIQDNIARVIARPTTGVYLGLFPFLNPQSPTARKQAVAFDGNLGDKFGYLSPPAAIERPWTPHQGSTIRYARSPESGEVMPVLEHSETHATPAIDEFQAGVIEAAPVFARWLSGLGIMASSLGPGLRTQLQDYFENPDPVIADIWFDSDHDDTFGAVGHAHIYAKPKPSPAWFEDPNAAAAAYAASGWPEGFAAWTPVRALNTALGQSS